MTQAVVNELLDLGLHHAPEYRGGLSNHMPMALGALAALGADEDGLRKFFDRYRPRLSLAATGGRPSTDWAQHLGHFDAYADLNASFRHMIAQQGLDSVMRQVLPRLMPGVGAAAFHGLIRTAYGVAAQHEGEIAAGLAYWACRWLRMNAAQMPAGAADDPATWLLALADELKDVALEGGLIHERMRAVARTEAFARHAGRLSLQADTLQILADHAARCYAATRNFTVLHLVTGTHAMRELQPWQEVPESALQHFAHAYAAAAIASGADLRAPLLPRPALGWPQVVDAALASHDEHVIKLVHSCRDESRVYGDGARLLAAALAVVQKG
jgi:hypothetical protein